MYSKATTLAQAQLALENPLVGRCVIVRKETRTDMFLQDDSIMVQKLGQDDAKAYSAKKHRKLEKAMFYLLPAGFVDSPSTIDYDTDKLDDQFVVASIVAEYKTGQVSPDAYSQLLIDLAGILKGEPEDKKQEKSKKKVHFTQEKTPKDPFKAYSKRLKKAPEDCILTLNTGEQELKKIAKKLKEFEFTAGEWQIPKSMLPALKKKYGKYELMVYEKGMIRAL